MEGKQDEKHTQKKVSVQYVGQNEKVCKKFKWTLRKEEKRGGHLWLPSGENACVMRAAHCSSSCHAHINASVCSFLFSFISFK